MAVTPFAEKNVFSVASNSTVSGLAFNSASREMIFIVVGPSATFGYVDVRLTKKTVIGSKGTIRIYLLLSLTFFIFAYTDYHIVAWDKFLVVVFVNNISFCWIIDPVLPVPF